jgi:hypothetical protein
MSRECIRGRKKIFIGKVDGQIVVFIIDELPSDRAKLLIQGSLEPSVAFSPVDSILMM